jgi:hypothetical protein
VLWRLSWCRLLVCWWCVLVYVLIRTVESLMFVWTVHKNEAQPYIPICIQAHTINIRVHDIKRSAATNDLSIFNFYILTSKFFKIFKISFYFGSNKIITFVHSSWSVCQQWNSLCIRTFTPGNDPCETEICRVVERHETWMVRLGTTWRAEITTAFVYIYQVIK